MQLLSAEFENDELSFTLALVPSSSWRLRDVWLPEVPGLKSWRDLGQTKASNWKVTQYSVPGSVERNVLTEHFSIMLNVPGNHWIKQLMVLLLHGLLLPSDSHYSLHLHHPLMWIVWNLQKQNIIFNLSWLWKMVWMYPITSYKHLNGGSDDSTVTSLLFRTTCEAGSYWK